VPRASVTMPARAAPSVALIAAVALNTLVRLRVPVLHRSQRTRRRLDSSDSRHITHLQVGVARDEQVGAHIERELHDMVVHRITRVARRPKRVRSPHGSNCDQTEQRICRGRRGIAPDFWTLKHLRQLSEEPRTCCDLECRSAYPESNDLATRAVGQQRRHQHVRVKHDETYRHASSKSRCSAMLGVPRALRLADCQSQRRRLRQVSRRLTRKLHAEPIGEVFPGGLFGHAEGVGDARPRLAPSSRPSDCCDSTLVEPPLLAGERPQSNQSVTSPSHIVRIS